MNVNRHTITINTLAFEGLKKIGKFGESYSELILRLVENEETETNEVERGNKN